MFFLIPSCSSRGGESYLKEPQQESSPSTVGRESQIQAGRRGLSSSLSFPRAAEAGGPGEPCQRVAPTTKHGRVGSDPLAIGHPATVQLLSTAAPARQFGSDLAVAGAVRTPAAAAAASVGLPGAGDLATTEESTSGDRGNGGAGSSSVRSSGGLAGQNDRTAPDGSAPAVSASTSALPGLTAPPCSSEAAVLLAATVVSEAATMGPDRGRWSRLIPSYKQRSDEFKKLFKGLPEDDRLLVDYSCAMQKDILVHGRLYLSQNWLCFYANLFGWESTISIPLRDITAINKCRTAKVIPNAIQITTAKDKFLFSSFVARDQTYLIIFRAWMCALYEHPITGSDLWGLVRWLYGSPQEAGSSGDALHVASEAAEELPLPLPSEHGADSSHIECESLERNSKNGSMAQVPTDAVEPTGPALNGTAAGHSSRSSSTSSSRSSSGASDEPGPDEDHDIVTFQDDIAEPVMAYCPTEDHEHRGALVLDNTFDLPASELFVLLFTDSTFFADFLAKRSTIDLVLSSWPPSPDADGIKRRTITYTLAINASFGPKRSPATEVQVMLPESVPGSFYAIDCECLNAPTLPYGENFYVLNKYCILRQSSTSCRLVVHSDIIYVKPVFSIVKGIIQRNVSSGVKDYIRQLNETLLAEVQGRDLRQPAMKAAQSGAAGEPGGDHYSSSSTAMVGLGGQGIATGKRGRSLRSASGCRPKPEAAVAGSPLTEPAKSQTAVVTPPGKLEACQASREHRGVHRRLLLNVALCLLLAANVLMFCHTWWLDTTSLELGGASCTGLGMIPDEVIRDQLEQHQRSHDEQAEHWRELFESSADMIHRLRRDIEELRDLVATKSNQSVVSG